MLNDLSSCNLSLKNVDVKNVIVSEYNLNLLEGLHNINVLQLVELTQSRICISSLYKCRPRPENS